MRNDSPTGHRVTIRLDGNGTSTNRQALGATVTLKTASGTQTRTLIPQRGYLSSSEPVLHFGLGADDSMEELTIHRNPHHTDRLSNLAGDHHYTITQSPSPSTRPHAPLPPVAPPHSPTQPPASACKSRRAKTTPPLFSKRLNSPSASTAKVTASQSVTSTVTASTT